MDSIQVKHVDNVGGLTFEEFWEAIVRCCLIFKKDVESLPTPEDKVKSTLQVSVCDTDKELIRRGCSVCF